MSKFEVDDRGLAAILERRGKAFAVLELIQNAWDSGSNRVAIRLEPIAGQPYATLEVEDFGEGFADLSHAFTMFAPSSRAAHADKRGRFNLGEKLVLAVCRKAEIITLTGSIAFDGSERRRGHKQRDAGTLFAAEIKMTRDDLADVKEVVKRLIPPVATTFNGVEIDRPDSICRFDTKLPTEIADADGQLRRTVRVATVEVYAAEDGHGEILELGIPVVELEAGYRVNVLQKIPLNMDRDNVTPGFAKTIQAALLNHVHDLLSPEEAAQPWAQEAAGDARATPEAVKAVIVKRFGDRAVIATVGDPMANAQAEANGFTVIPGGALSGAAWANVKKHALLQSSGKVFPTPKPEELAAQHQQACPLCGKPI